MTDFIHKKSFIAVVIGITVPLFLVASFFPMSMEVSSAGYYTYKFGWFFSSWLTIYGFSGNETLFSLLAHNDGFWIDLSAFAYVLFMCGLSSFILCFVPCWLAALLKKRKVKAQ